MGYLRTKDSVQVLRCFFVYFSDLSNPMKGWEVCEYWAAQALEEMFCLGDTEKSMGIPVQPMNDRDECNPANTQITFIQFFVGPMLQHAVRLIPPLMFIE